MKQFKGFLRHLAGCLGIVLLLTAAACGTEEIGEKKATTDTSEVAGEYCLDLTDLGMKMMLYLRLDAEGGFLFSNSQEFAVDKGSGSFQKSGDAYIMVYTSVNGEEKSVSDGITSSFTVTEDGKLDFSIGEKVYYGSVGVNTTSAENTEAKLLGVLVSQNADVTE